MNNPGGETRRGRVVRPGQRKQVTDEGTERPTLLVHPRGFWFLAALASLSAPLHAQILIHGSGPHQRANIFNTDLAVLESGDQRKDLPCTVTPSKPTLGFDLKFHAGYQVTVPLKELAGSENALTIVFRVAPDDHRDEPAYFVQHLRV